MRVLPHARKAQSRTSSDAELLAAVSEGDLSALGALYDRHARDIWRVLERVTNGSSDVEDVLHATFLSLPKVAARFDRRAPTCRNWLCGIATCLALRQRRSLRRFTLMLARFGMAAERPPSADPESQASSREDLGTLERAIAALTPKKRAVFVLVECEGLSHREVAASLQIPLATVRTRLFAAKDDLRVALLRREAWGEA